MRYYYSCSDVFSKKQINLVNMLNFSKVNKVRVEIKSIRTVESQRTENLSKVIKTKGSGRKT